MDYHYQYLERRYSPCLKDFEDELVSKDRMEYRRLDKTIKNIEHCFTIHKIFLTKVMINFKNLSCLYKLLNRCFITVNILDKKI